MCWSDRLFESCVIENWFYFTNSAGAGTWIILAITNHVKHISFTSHGIFSVRNIFHLLRREPYNIKESHGKCVSRIVSWLQSHASWCCGLKSLCFPSKHWFLSTSISGTQNVMSWNLALELQTEMNTFLKELVQVGQAISFF